jgi:hypothetical protein
MSEFPRVQKASAASATGKGCSLPSDWDLTRFFAARTRVRIPRINPRTANGSFAWDPNHAFDALAAPGSGAGNIQATGSFTYTVTGGATATITGAHTAYTISRAYQLRRKPE